MAPPTGASDSILILRRNGASVDRCHGLLAPHLQNYSMTANENRVRKAWGDRWSVTRTAKPCAIDGPIIESSSFMVHPDYLNKYGTLSNGVLTKSVKYAETWLYGTVAVRPATQRPSLFLYPGVVGPAPRHPSSQPTYLSSPANLPPVPLSGYSPTEGNPRLHLQAPGAGSRKAADQADPAAGAQEAKNPGDKKGGTSRCAGGGGGRLRSRDAGRDKKPLDPYNLMRKNRLGAIEEAEASAFGGQVRRRNASASPVGRQPRDSTASALETFKPKAVGKEANPWKTREEEVSRRRSILECDVDVYELNNSKLKEDMEDSNDEFAGKTAQPSVHTKLKISRPKLNKTEQQTNAFEAKSQVAKTMAPSENFNNTEVRLNGQRFKIFDGSGPSSAVLDEFLSDPEDPSKPSGALVEPKRPPRRPKEKPSNDHCPKRTKSRSKSSPNLSIKSILKKNSRVGDAGEGAISQVPPPALDSLRSSENASDSTDVPPSSRPDHAARPCNQGTLKKKKQVQFRENNSYESLLEAPASSLEAKTTEPSDPMDFPKSTETDAEPEGPTRAQQLPILSPKDCEPDQLTAHQRERRKDEPALAKESVSEAEPGLKRSYSDRRVTSGYRPTSGNGESPSTTLPVSNSHLFNDTMALRTRPAKPGTREVFSKTLDLDEKSQTATVTSKSCDVLNRNSGKLIGKIITYAEFSKLPDGCDAKRDKGSLSGLTNKSNPPVKSFIPVKTNSSLPSPPPRHVTADKSSFNGKKVSLRVPAKECKTLALQKPGNPSQAVTSPQDPSTIRPAGESETSDGKTVVRLVASPSEDGKPSIKIHPKNLVHPASLDARQRKTSLIISNFHAQDSNKVTISVRNDSFDDQPNSSTCTIIETGSNSTVIPVVSTDNKTTLIVGTQTPVGRIRPSFPDSATDFFPKPSRYLFSNLHSEEETPIESLDPVQAIKRNLIPHICGKVDGVLTLMQRLTQSREAGDGTKIGQIFVTSTREGPSHQNDEVAKMKPEGKEGQVPEQVPERAAFTTPTWPSVTKPSFEGDGSATTLTHHISSSLASSPFNFYSPAETEDFPEREKDKLECEYEISDGFRKKESENIYEMIKEEPIYDQIAMHLPPQNRNSPPPPPPPPPVPLPSQTTSHSSGPEDPQKMTAKSMFEGASKYDILNYLVDAKERVQEDSYWTGGVAAEAADLTVLVAPPHNDSLPLRDAPGDPSERTEAYKKRPTPSENESEPEPDSSSRISSQLSYSSDDNATTAVATEPDPLKITRKSSAEIERNDSGVGSETSHTSRSKWQVSSSIREDPQNLCEDCDQIVETQITDGGVMYVPLVCRKCAKKRSERKEIIQEIVDTEEKYGRDLKIILEEFYKPMLVAGLLTPDQLASIFLNTEELLENSQLLTERLRDTLEIAADQGDEDLLTVNVGKLFLDTEPMLHAFETYCIRQGAAAMLLAALEKEKELLRIFLRVSQMENAVLRRMNLNSFLMVPVQRVTKYPLLLARLYKVTPAQQEGRELLKEAQHNIELHLEHMNSEAKDVSGTKVWRRFSTSAAAGRRSTTESEMVNIKLRKMAVDVLEWNHEEVRFILEGKLLYTQPTENNWKRGRTIKLSPIFVLLVTLGKPNSRYKVEPAEDELTFPTKTGIREATLLLVKEKCGRYTLIREPLYLDKIIVCCETDLDEYFEVQELLTKDSFIFKAEDGEKTKEWYKQVQYHAQILGAWRKRRNALANIMINGMLTRTSAV